MINDNSADRLLEAVDEKQNPSMVGLDPRISRIPEHVRMSASRGTSDPFEKVSDSILEFNKAIIDSVRDIVPCVKLQIAFYEQYGSKGISSFSETISYAKSKGLVVISDVKRNDIGSTAEAYADGHLGKVELVDGTCISSFDADMITVNPYLGIDGVEPFLKVCKKFNKGIFILDKTSNPSSKDFQNRRFNGDKHLYELVARKISEWGEDLMGERGYSSVGTVVGATYPEEAKKLRKIMKNNIFLVPGYGAQGGTADDVIPCFNDDGYGAVVNSSRGIIFANEREPYNQEYDEEEFAEASRRAALDMKEDILRSLKKGDKIPEGW